MHGRTRLALLVPGVLAALVLGIAPAAEAGTIFTSFDGLLHYQGSDEGTTLSVSVSGNGFLFEDSEPITNTDGSCDIDPAQNPPATSTICTRPAGTWAGVFLDMLGGNDTATCTLPSTKRCDGDGGSGNDSLTGGSGFDVLSGGEGDDSLTGGDGSDRLIPGLGADTVNGSIDDWIDTADFSPESVGITLTIGAGNSSSGDTVANVDQLIGTSGNDILTVGSAPASINGGPGNDRLGTGPAGQGQLYGGPGDDTFVPYGTDGSFEIYYGGDGFDTLDFAASQTTANMRARNEIEHYVGGPGNDQISTSNQYICPGALCLAVTLEGNAGNDYLEGGYGLDTIAGGAGADIIRGSGAADQLTGGAGEDTIGGEGGDDTIAAVDGEKDTIQCGDGNDVLSADPVDVFDASCEGGSVVITSGPSGTVGRSSATFEFSAPGAQPGSFECRLDAATFDACVSPRSYTSVVDGPHTFEVRYRLTSGGTFAPTSRTWTVDTTAPDVTVTSGPAGEGNPPDATFEFTSSEPGGATFRCSVDLGPAEDCSSPHTLLGLAVGEHVFSVAAHDSVGNESSLVSRTWRVASPAPAITVNVACAPGREPSVTFGVVVAKSASPAACFFKQSVEGHEVMVSPGPVMINGINFDPDPGALVIVDHAFKQGIVRTTGPATLRFGAVPLPVPFGFEWTEANTTQANKVFSIADAVQGEGSFNGMDFLKLKFGVAPSFELSADNGGQTKVSLKLALPNAVLRGLPGAAATQERGLTFDLGFTTSNDKGVSFQGKATVAQAYLFGKLKVKDLALAIDSAGPAVAVAGSLVMGPDRVVSGAEFRLEIAIGPGGTLGGFVKRASLQASSVNKPVAEFIFLQRFGGEFASTDPPGWKLSANAGLSLGPELDFTPFFKGTAISVDGKLEFNNPQAEASPWSIEISGEEKVVEVPVASATVKYTYGQRVNLGGKIDHTIAGYGALFEIDPAKTWVTLSAFNVEGSAEVRLPGGVLSGKADAIVSSRGMAACFGAPNRRVGFTKVWGSQLLTLADSCDVARARAIAQPAQAASAQRVTVPRGVGVFVIDAAAAIGAPALTVTGPGLTLESPENGSGVRRREALLIPDSLRKTTSVVLFDPRPGQYVVSSRPTGLSPAPTISITTGRSRPPVRVSARVRGGRLHWKLTPQKGQSVRFVDIGATGTRVVATTRRASGSASLSRTPGAHRIDAVVLQDGLPRVNRSVARYRAAKIRLRRPSRLRLKGTRLSWRGQQGAAGYTVQLSLRDGTVISRSTRKPSLRVPKTLKSAVVVPTDSAGVAGPRARLKRKSVARAPRG